jgi:hypothetical protein
MDNTEKQIIICVSIMSMQGGRETRSAITTNTQNNDDDDDYDDYTTTNSTGSRLDTCSSSPLSIHLPAYYRATR